MNRRTFLGGAATTSALLAGCSELGDSGDSGNDTAPIQPVREFYDSAGEGDRETANAQLHPNGNWEPLDQEGVQLHDDANQTVEDAVVVDRSESTAIVEAEIVLHPDTDSSTRVTVRVETRKHDGEWLIYGDPEEPEGLGSPPSATWEIDERRNDAGDVAAVLFRHSGGDTVPFSELSIHVGGESIGSGSSSKFMAGGDEMGVEFGPEGEAVSEGTSVELVWTPGGEMLASHTLPAATAGAASFVVDP